MTDRQSDKISFPPRTKFLRRSHGIARYAMMYPFGPKRQDVVD